MQTAGIVFLDDKAGRAPHYFWQRFAALRFGRLSKIALRFVLGQPILFTLAVDHADETDFRQDITRMACES